MTEEERRAAEGRVREWFIDRFPQASWAGVDTEGRVLVAGALDASDLRALAHALEGPKE